MNFLVIEDDKSSRGLVKKLLQKEFPIATIYELENGIGALDYIGLFNVDLVITDVMMAYADGVSTTKITERFPEIPVILISGSQEHISQWRELGASVGVLKPINARDLMVKVHELLEKKGSQNDSSYY